MGDGQSCSLATERASEPATIIVDVGQRIGGMGAAVIRSAAQVMLKHDVLVSHQKREYTYAAHLHGRNAQCSNRSQCSSSSRSRAACQRLGRLCATHARRRSCTRDLTFNLDSRVTVCAFPFRRRECRDALPAAVCQKRQRVVHRPFRIGPDSSGSRKMNSASAEARPSFLIISHLFSFDA